MAPDAAGVRVGDAVYALSSFCRDGSAAEFIAIRAADLAPAPRSLNFEQAAAVPLAGLTAWQALFDHAQIEKGARVLIHGAAGGVGTYAVQLAKWKGAEVIATAPPYRCAVVAIDGVYSMSGALPPLAGVVRSALYRRVQRC